MPAHDKSRDHLFTPPLRMLALFTLVVAIGYFAREVLLPFSLAVLLSFLLAPLATRLQRWGLGRIGGVVVSVALAFAVLGGLGWVIGRNILDVASQLPKYEDRLVAKVKSLRPSGRNPLTKAAETVERIEQELVSPEETEEAAATPEAESRRRRTEFTLRETLFGAEPLPVRVVDTSFKPLKVLEGLAPYMAPLGSAAIVIVFVIFILVERENLRDRIIRLAGTSRVYVTTQALEDAAQRVSRYLLMQLMINSIYGAAVGVGLYFIGLPNAVLWGLLATVLRFLPYVGPIIGALTPIALSFAVFEGWWLPLMTMALFIVAELITNNVLEPWLYGSTTGVSTLAIVVSAVFWTWLWGPVGLVLATPLTVCVTVMARHVPQMAFLNILLADEPPLELRYRFYQRLLAQDYEDAADVTAEFLRSGSLHELYQTMYAPALALAERDRDAGRLTAAQESFIYESISDLVEDTFEDYQMSGANAAPPPVEAAEDEEGAAPGDDEEPVVPDLDAEEAPPPRRILCIAAEDEADRIASLMFSHLLLAQGYVADSTLALGADEETLRQIEDEGIEGIAVSVIAAGKTLRLRSVCRKLRRRAPHTSILVGVWNAPSRLERMEGPVKKAGANAIVATFKDGIDFFRDQLPLPTPTTIAKISDDDA